MEFAIGYKFHPSGNATELYFYTDNVNILEFSRGGKRYTTKWNLDELAVWLRKFITNISEDPFPFDVKGNNAAEKDENARDFDSDDLDAFDAYYDKLDEWNDRHSWHSKSSGAILANLYFELKNDFVEISWNNNILEDEVEFVEKVGSFSVRKEEFVGVIDEFLKEYADYWYPID